MVFTIINAYGERDDHDLKLSELVYILESKELNVHVIKLRELSSNDFTRISDIIETSDFVIYTAPLDSKLSRKKLSTFLKKNNIKKHPPLFLVLDSYDLLSVKMVETYIDEFERFADQLETTVVDAKYFKDAIEMFKKMKRT